MGLGVVAVVGVAAGLAALDAPGAEGRIDVDERQVRAGVGGGDRQAVAVRHHVGWDRGGRGKRQRQRSGLGHGPRCYHARMEFGQWYPLTAAEAHAPAGPGVLVRVRTGLVEYPRGKSAMVHYQAADDVRAAASRAGRRSPRRAPTGCAAT